VNEPALEEPEPDDVESDTYRPWYRDSEYEDDDADRLGSDEAADAPLAGDFDVASQSSATSDSPDVNACRVVHGP